MVIQWRARRAAARRKAMKKAEKISAVGYREAAAATRRLR
jgi:hypothetical protein